MIANAVNVEGPTIERIPANELDPDSDLGKLLVTSDIGKLTTEQIETALDNGALVAEQYLARGLIQGAVLMLRGDNRVIGAPVARITLKAA